MKRALAAVLIVALGAWSRAQNGDDPAHSRAESEKTPATRKSGIPMERPIAGNTEIIPVLPMAVTSETPKMIANDDLGRLTATGADLGMAGCYDAPPKGESP